MKITILAVGKVKEKFYSQAAAEYIKRLSRYCRLDVIEVADEKTPDGASDTVNRKIKDKEGERLLSHIKDGMYVIALAIEGRQRSSEELADRLAELGLRGDSSLVFVIGGSLGLSESVMARADESLSFSRMTFPHQLMRVILLEQVYRGFRIMHGEPYHK
ncbi:23S rRNA (pseudouridine(1915)-N(3))-methyltransferase RlmH [Lacrimispora sp. NSJ-141]|uniref:Ribosomal RNA large subunit methyltransferase H n=1 Tax=Lientehia hominis TaxID=2897778 RepID=A0AAP2W7L9_9FIRM|nr:23S rRNA (pseudouridine(1915)-N(3))-methyltransferase RlmH [Lientehia hominis]MCD2492583.1 23S rRNA (pseudouridine(1915)-N(3))-methyltransferase RlmH [Lientehia hominis]